MSATAEIKPTKEIAKRVVETVSKGLCSGLGGMDGRGRGIPGAICVEAAVCYAFGLPHGDNPPCVGSAVRSFKIALNDCEWASNESRARGMRKLSVAQLGSNEIDQVEFAKLLALRTTQRLLPKLFRIIAERFDGEHKKSLLDQADKCEAVKDLHAARYTARYASAAATAARYAARYASAAATAATAASYASDAAATAATAASAASYASATAARYASATARYASAAATAARYASATVDAASEEFLLLAADIGLQVLKELKSPGCEWLDLCD